MTAAVLPLVLGMYGLALLLCAVRLLRGPDVLDRVLALDTLYVLALALAVALSIHWHSMVNYEAVLAIAMLGFVGTVAAARYLVRHAEDA